MKTREEIRAALTGPVASVNVPFWRDGAIDFAGLRNILEFDIAAGSPTLLLTYGDSLYSILTDDEVAEVTKVVVQHAAGRAMVVVADRMWWTGKTVEFARFARDVGADVLMVSPPDWAASATAASLTEHYRVVSEEMPVMLVTAAFLARPRAFALETLALTLEQAPGVVAIKDDLRGDFGRKMSLLVQEQWAVFSGGLKQSYLDTWPYGCDGYLSTFISFLPQIAHDYWAAIQASDMATAKRIIRDYEMPFFDMADAMPGNFDATIHGTLELFGIAGRWRRPPYHSLSDEEMERVKDWFGVTRQCSELKRDIFV